MWILKGEAMSYNLPQGQTILGRKDCPISINDKSLSRKHCEFHADIDELRITDLKSKYGLQVNGQKTESAVLKNMDKVVIGGYGLAFKVIHNKLSICFSQIPSKEKQELTAIATQKLNTGGKSVLNAKPTPYDDNEYVVVPEGDSEPYALEINDLSKAIMAVNANFVLRNMPAVQLDSISKTCTQNQFNTTNISDPESLGLNQSLSPLEAVEHEGILSRTKLLLSEQLESNHRNTQGESIIQKALTQMPETATNFDDFMDDLFDLGTGNQISEENEPVFKVPGETNENSVLDLFDVPVKQEPGYTQTQIEVEETRDSLDNHTRLSNTIENSLLEPSVKFENSVNEISQSVNQSYSLNNSLHEMDHIQVKNEPIATQYEGQLPSQLDLNYTSQLDPGDLPIIPQSEAEPEMVEYILPSKRPQSQQIVLPEEEESQMELDPKVIVEFTGLVKKDYRPQTNFKRFKSKTRQITVPLKVALITSKKGFHFDD
ncbi:hypothetical protein HK103_001169 [Boothiomyces macroporosus]|uniref:FHA domain-containing protein n=1 Tax=Boothiomyces macroporosus TaxID=261099 RepID=A0AAD5Y5K1_9FUNG|nr:hypothetical protein HK103_001169 [Boothiomyces macroporosus]